MMAAAFRWSGCVSLPTCPFVSTSHHRRRPILRYAPTVLVEMGWWIWALLDPPTRLGRFAQPSPYVGHYYYMTLTMTLGSLVAGATSEGGGAVAFPVMTLALGVPPPVARDFSFAIQSFGMTCAGVTILGLSTPVDVAAALWGSAGGAVGLATGLIGVAPFLPPAYAKMLFVSLWVAFAVALYRLNRADRGRKVYASSVDSDRALGSIEMQDEECTDVVHQGANSSNSTSNETTYKRIAVLVGTGLFGGLCTSVAGSGLDMATFSILTLYYHVDEKVATPTSVILMAGNAVLGVVLRSLGWGGRYPGNEETYIWNFVSVCIPVVVIGAPLGATISAKLSRGTIAGMLYVLDAIQFVAALAIVRPWSAPPPNNVWLCVSSVLTLAVGSIFFYKIASLRERRDEKETSSSSSLRIQSTTSVDSAKSSGDDESDAEVDNL